MEDLTSALHIFILYNVLLNRTHVADNNNNYCYSHVVCHLMECVSFSKRPDRPLVNCSATPAVRYRCNLTEEVEPFVGRERRCDEDVGQSSAYCQR